MAPRRHPKPAAGKKEDFQVRVRVLEGHQLQGSAIKPVVTVLIGEQRFRSRIRAGNNPYYNEVFSHHFHLTPTQLAAVPIHIQVLNSRAIRADAIIGAFKLDVGTIYNAPGKEPCRVLGVTELHRGDVCVPNGSRAQDEWDVAEPAAPPAPRCWMLWVPVHQRGCAACRRVRVGEHL
ncbi:myoferlin-like [Excalfactoria chinensis]|uniref:myoferlin-like n=1 Tax=Excalfactoria chinensis TaxID=46218 RepID=UPI003B3ACA23